MLSSATGPQSARSPWRLSDKLLTLFRRAWDHGAGKTRRGAAGVHDRDIQAQRLIPGRLTAAHADRAMQQAPPPVALNICGLVKRFERPAVGGLDLSVPAGQFYTLLGPNGAGKTTTMRLVTGLLRPDHGSITVHGLDALADPLGAKRIMAWVSDEPMIYDKLTPTEYLAFVAGLWSIDPDLAAEQAQDLLSRFGLEPHAHERCERLSKGMRQKVALAGALVHDPKLILLDEPLTGLDAGSARLIKRVLRDRVQAGCSVIMTTHILEVAERMADRIGVMANGMLIAEGTLDELRRQAGSGHASLEDTFLALVAQGTAAG
ncbi:MAG TPA: ABC transporter ATP-binding protein [Acetobacteraceae bacterium]|nr:ABC transporter ATP-binding protein [Acetobacteraceae bacterium]